MDTRSRKILVTGGSGFAGSHLITELKAQGFSDIYTTTFSKEHSNFTLLPSERCIQVDLTNRQETEGLIANLKPDWIFHLASFAYVGKSFEKATELLNNNIGLQVAMLEAVKLHAPQARMLVIGSAEEYGVVDPNLELIDETCPLNPVNPYAVSKVAQDMLAGAYFLSFRMNIVRARSFNHIGTRQSPEFVIPAFAKQIVAIERGQQQTLNVGNTEAIRDFSSVKDVAKAYIVLMEKGESGQIYNIGSGVGIAIKDVIALLSKLATVPISITQDESRLRPLDVPRMVADNRKMKALGWTPTVPLEEELLAILTEWRQT